MKRFLTGFLVLTALSGVGRCADAPAVDAEVNGEKIFRSDVERLMKSITSKEASLLSDTAEAKKALAELRGTIVDNLVVQKLLVQEARRRKIVPNAKAVEQGVTAFRARYDSDKEFEDSLAAEGKTPADVKKVIGDELMIRELTQQLSADITITDADLKAHMAANPAEFALPEMVRARHILVAYPDKATDAQKKAAKTKAEGLLKKALVKNADFPKLARENTDDAGTKDVGGDLDFAERGMFVKSFEDAMFSAPPGVVAKLVETEYGLHIIKVEQKEAARQLKFEEVRGDERLRLRIRQQKIKARLDAQIESLRAKAKITLG